MSRIDEKFKQREVTSLLDAIEQSIRSLSSPLGPMETATRITMVAEYGLSYVAVLREHLSQLPCSGAGESVSYKDRQRHYTTINAANTEGGERCAESILRPLCVEHPHVKFVDGVLSGETPLVNGTRLAVHHVLWKLAIGTSVDEIKSTWSIDDEIFKDVMTYAQDVLEAVIDIERKCVVTAPPEPALADDERLATYQQEYERLFNWRDLWNRLSNSKRFKLASQNDRIEEKAARANRLIGKLITDYDAAPTAAAPVVDRRCGFCGKSDREVPTLIKAAAGYVCNECVKICADIIQRNEPGTTPPGEAAMNAARALAAAGYLNCDVFVKREAVGVSDRRLAEVAEVLTAYIVSAGTAPAAREIGASVAYEIATEAVRRYLPEESLYVGRGRRCEEFLSSQITTVLATTRAAAIDECVARVDWMRNQRWAKNAVAANPHYVVFVHYMDAASEIATALTALKQDGQSG